MELENKAKKFIQSLRKKKEEYYLFCSEDIMTVSANYNKNSKYILFFFSNERMEEQY